jgi:hypothetical protein
MLEYKRLKLIHDSEQIHMTQALTGDTGNWLTTRYTM